MQDQNITPESAANPPVQAPPPAAAQISAPQQSVPSSPEPPKKKGKKVAAIVVAVLLFFGAIGSCSNSETEQPDQGVNQPEAPASSNAEEPDPSVEDQPETTPAPEVVEVDKSELNEAIATYGIDDTSVYTDDSATAYSTALSAAQTAADSPDATQAEVDSAADALADAYIGLQAKLNEADYSEMAFKDVARNPDAFVGSKLKCSGKVLQVLEGDDETDVRLATDGSYDDVVFVGFDPGILDVRVLEDDMITVYGTCLGLYTYKATLGQEISLPAIYAEKVVIDE